VNSLTLKDNPVALSIMSVLKNTHNVISLYDLIKHIEALGLVFFDDEENISNEILLFRKNFIVMNALYQIQVDMQRTGYALYISSLKILFYSDVSSKNDLSLMDIEESKRVDESLSEYYLNWDNYDSASQQTIDQLLNSFWTKYQKYNQFESNQDKRSCALQILGVESAASWKDIQQAYRQKITLCHPDKGGTSHQFIEIREAFQFLKLFQ
jgi:DNA-J related protein/DnaJ domain